MALRYTQMARTDHLGIIIYIQTALMGRVLKVIYALMEHMEVLKAIKWHLMELMLMNINNYAVGS